MTYAEAVIEARRQMSRLDNRWATATEAELVRHVCEEDCSIFTGQNAVRYALCGTYTCPKTGTPPDTPPGATPKPTPGILDWFKGSTSFFGFSVSNWLLVGAAGVGAGYWFWWRPRHAKKGILSTKNPLRQLFGKTISKPGGKKRGYRRRRSRL